MNVANSALFTVRIGELGGFCVIRLKIAVLLKEQGILEISVDCTNFV